MSFFSLTFFLFAIGIVNVEQISFVTQHFYTADLGYSITESMWGFGMVVGCALIVLLERKLRDRHIFGASFLVCSVSILALVLVRNYPFALLCFFMIGATNCFISILSTTLIQKNSNRAVVGKRLGTKTQFTQIFTIAGMSAAGFLDLRISAANLYLAAGGFILLGGILFMLFARSKKRRPQQT